MNILILGYIIFENFIYVQIGNSKDDWLFFDLTKETVEIIYE